MSGVEQQAVPLACVVAAQSLLRTEVLHLLDAEVAFDAVLQKNQHVLGAAVKSRCGAKVDLEMVARQRGPSERLDRRARDP